MKPYNVDPLWIRMSILFSSLLIAIVSARPYAGSWNDGSRLASVEALVDHHSFAIDSSVFVQVPQDLLEAGYPPYPAENKLLVEKGTLDKLWIDGHFYTDKPLLLSFGMAGLYQVWRWCDGPSFRERPDLVCRALTISTSGLAYVFGIWCIYQLACLWNLPVTVRLVFPTIAAVASTNVAYVQHVNNHVILFGVISALLLQLVRYREDRKEGWKHSRRGCLIGLLGGLAYSLDLGLGPILLVSLTVLMVYRSSFVVFCLFVLGLLPGLLGHHGINYAVGGTLAPANSVPAYLNWPGSPFTEANMTGLFRHSIWKLPVYSLALLFGKQGFLGHNLPLFLCLPAIASWLRNRDERTAEVVFASVWMVGGWLMYACFSNNYGGVNCSIRWFIPFLAPGLFLIGEHVQHQPKKTKDLLLLTCCGLVLGITMWWNGPWAKFPLKLYWPLQGMSLFVWGTMTYQIWKKQPTQINKPDLPTIRQAA